MYQGKLVFSQIMAYLPKYEFNKCVSRYKGNYKVKSFYGTSENAIKTQIWIAITMYLLVAIVKKQARISLSIYTFLQILSVSIFEQVHILQLVKNQVYKKEKTINCNQLNLFDL